MTDQDRLNSLIGSTKTAAAKIKQQAAEIDAMFQNERTSVIEITKFEVAVYWGEEGWGVHKEVASYADAFARALKLIQDGHSAVHIIETKKTITQIGRTGL